MNAEQDISNVTDRHHFQRKPIALLEKRLALLLNAANALVQLQEIATLSDFTYAEEEALHARMRGLSA